MISEHPFISIIIPVRNSKLLKSTVNALTLQTRLDIVKEILIVGQQDIDNYARMENLNYIHVEDSPTPAHNRNVGARSATGDWLVFTDSDCVPKPKWIEEITKVISPKEVVIAGAVDVPRDMSYWGMCDHYLGFSTTAYGLAFRRSIPYAPTLNLAIKRCFFSEIGGFNESFLSAGGEDRELCWRIIHGGNEIHFVNQAIVIHDHQRKNFQSAARHIFNYGIVTGQFRMMHADQWSWMKQIGMRLARIPLIGEFGSLAWIFARGMARLFSKVYLKKIKYLPGIMILDLSHRLGMIKALRQNKV